MDEKNTNNSQDQNPFEEKPSKQPKRDKKRRAYISKRAVSAIYLGIALCMVAVLTVSLVSTSNKVKDDLNSLGDISVKVPDVSITVPELSKPDDKDDKPTGGEASGVDDQVEKPEDKDPEPVVKYVMPVDGEVLKGCFLDSLVFSDTMQDFRTHSGVDLAAELGGKVAAYTDGTVSKVEKDPFMGTSVKITHSGGIVSVYRNLAEEVAVEEGDEVKAGDTIGAVGQSALLEVADAPHLHFELWANGVCINSEDELKSIAKD